MNCHYHMIAAYPELSHLLEGLPLLPPLSPQPLPVAEAITKIVVGQMLSRAAADTIYSRLLAACFRRKLKGSWQLPETELLNGGLSRSKVRAIREFSLCYDRDPLKFEAWHNLDYLDLSEAVSEYWGLSQWSADMLSIFYFAKPDVFPSTDGTIVRVRRTLEERFLQGPLEPDLARPNRTYLARCMWAFQDRGLLK